MAWISVHTGIDGPKLREFRKMLGCSKFEATGILVYLWFWGLENANEEGRILHADKEDIEECLQGAAAGCKIPPSAIVDALIESGWIDKAEDGSCFFIHDWQTWQKQWYAARDRREKDAEKQRLSRAKKSKKADSDGKKSDSTGDSNGDNPRTVKGDQLTLEPEKPEEPKETKALKYAAPFEAFWEVYPRKVEKSAAYQKYSARRKDGFSDEELISAAKAYASECKRFKTEKKYIKHAATFLGPNTPFTDYLQKKSQIIRQTPTTPEEEINPFADFGEEGN